MRETAFSFSQGLRRLDNANGDDYFLTRKLQSDIKGGQRFHEQ